MISPTQRELLETLAHLCELSPDMRFGQMLAHLGFLAEDDPGRSLWEVEDEEFLAVLRRHEAALSARQQHVA